MIFENNRFSGITLSLYFGDTSKQARHFYNRKIEFQMILPLFNKEWTCWPNFHLSFMSTGLIWFDTSKDNIEKYYWFWQNNMDKIKQYQKDELRRLLDELQGLGLIVINHEIENKLESEIFKTKRELINVCPGFGLLYKYSAKEATDLDSKNKLIEDLKERIKEGLGIVNQDINFIK